MGRGLRSLAPITDEVFAEGFCTEHAGRLEALELREVRANLEQQGLKTLIAAIATRDCASGAAEPRMVLWGEVLETAVGETAKHGAAVIRRLRASSCTRALAHIGERCFHLFDIECDGCHSILPSQHYE